MKKQSDPQVRGSLHLSHYPDQFEERAVGVQFKNYPIFIVRPDPESDENDSMMAQRMASKAADDYVDGVREALEFVDRPGVGRLVLDALPKQMEVKIVKRPRGKDTRTIPLDPVHAARAGAILDPGTVYQRQAVGGGSASVIRFTPGLDIGVCVNHDGNGPCAGMQDDELLVHELVHALRQMKGTFNAIPLSKAPDQNYDDVEEFYAILVANIYMSERGETQLVRDHHSSQSLKSAWSTSEGFLSDATNKEWVRKFCKFEETDLSTRIKSLSMVKFNPIGYYLTKIEP
jgi:hypothetical protein